MVEHGDHVFTVWYARGGVIVGVLTALAEVHGMSAVPSSVVTSIRAAMVTV